MQLVLTGQAAPADAMAKAGASWPIATERKESAHVGCRDADHRDRAHRTVLRHRAGPRRGRRGEEIAKILFVVPAALAIIALFGYPVVKNLLMSFQNYTLRTFFTGKAPWVGLQNYVTVVTDEALQQGAGQHRAVHDRLDRRAVRDRDAAGPVLPQELSR